MKISKVRNMIQGFLVDKVAIVGGRELLSRTMRTTMIKVGNCITVKSRAVDRSTIQFVSNFGVLLTEMCY